MTTFEWSLRTQHKAPSRCWMHSLITSLWENGHYDLAERNSKLAAKLLVVFSQSTQVENTMHNLSYRNILWGKCSLLEKDQQGWMSYLMCSPHGHCICPCDVSVLTWSVCGASFWTLHVGHQQHQHVQGEQKLPHCRSVSSVFKQKKPWPQSQHKNWAMKHSSLILPESLIPFFKEDISVHFASDPGWLTGKRIKIKLKTGFRE